MGKPKTFAELYEFYYEICKPIYGHLTAANQPPQETWWEVSAAFDHISRQYKYGEPEAEVVDRAAAHLKRSCLDAFKLVLKLTRDKYDELLSIDIGAIDQGRFKRSLIELWGTIEQEARTARTEEGKANGIGDYHRVFDDHWAFVYKMCLDLDTRFYKSGDVQWQKRRDFRRRVMDWVIGGIVGAVLGLLLGSVWGAATSWFSGD